MRSNQCIFCPNPADSKEHIWSDWILKLLPEGKDGIFTRMDRDGVIHTRKALKPDVTAKVVCEKDCNNGWMSRKLEEPMKAATSDIILANKRKAFTSDECVSMAAWAFKTTVLANHIGLENEPFFPDWERHAFARNLSIPFGVQVWLAQRNAGYLTGTFRSIQRFQQESGPIMPHLIRPPDSPYMFKSYTCTFVIGLLAIQVLALRWAQSDLRRGFGDPAPKIIDNGRFAEHVIPIWPNYGFSAVWPPARSVNNDEFETFWDRFETFRVQL